MKKTLTACLLLALVVLTACGQKQSLQETLPTLSLSAGGGRSVPIREFGYSWTAGREGVVVDTVHPLDALETLPGVSVESGTAIDMSFSRLPDSVRVLCWNAGDADSPSDAESREVETAFTNNLFQFVPPESEGDLVFQVLGQWDSYRDVKGTVGYAFVVTQG